MGHIKPFYGVDSIKKIVDKISEVDVKINELLIEREQYVEAFKEAIAKEDIKEA